MATNGTVKRELCKGVGTKFEVFGGGMKICPECGKQIAIGYTSLALFKHTPKKA